jgi:hypothetical protein
MPPSLRHAALPGLILLASLSTHAQNTPATPPPASAAAGSAQAPDPARDPELRAAMANAMQTPQFERIAALSEEQRRKLGEYFRAGKAAGVKGTVLGMGLGALVRGFVAVEEVRKFVAAYRETGRQTGRLPLPHPDFAAAAERFPDAAKRLAPELDAARKMGDEIKTIRTASATNPDRLYADDDRQAADGFRRAADRGMQATGGPAADLQKNIEAIEAQLKEFK